MNEFRRPYEYEEENGVAGFILVFFLMLIAVEPMMSISLAYMGQLILGSFPVLRGIFITLFFVQFALLLITCVTLFKKFSMTLKVVRIYLFYRLISLTLASVIIFICYLLYYIAPTAGPSMFESLFELILYMLVLPLVYVVPFSVLWYIYFKRSKRVKSTYLKQQ